MSSTDPGSPTASDLVLRPATEEDARALAEVHLASRRAAVPAMPPSVHTDEETMGWVAGWLAGDAEVWVAEAAGRPVGYARLTAGWLDDLYVRPEAARQGVGSALLELVKSLRPGGFALWVFESNEPARRFYRRRGLVELEHTDGSDNEERAPDLRMAWPGEDPVGYLRSQVDEVDDDLAKSLARRAALTAAIQGYKPVPGHAGRDPDREAEIAARMARHAPELGEPGLRRIMHEVITVSLDAYARAATIAAYDADADRYAEGTSGPLPLQVVRLHDDLAARLPEGSEVLEIGSGPGRDARALEERGLRVRRTDVTPAFVERLRVQGYDADVLDPLRDDLGGPYDGVYANAVLLHLSPDECTETLRRLRAATRTGGPLALTLKEGEGGGWSTHGDVRGARHFTYWRAEELREALTAAGWVVDRLDVLPPGGRSPQRWLHVVATAG